MGVKDTARRNGLVRLPPLAIPYDGSAGVSFLLDCGQDGRRVTIKDKEDTAKAKERWTLVVDQITDTGETAARTLWLNEYQFADLAAILPETGGTVEIHAKYLPREGANLRDDGTPWLDLTFWLMAGEGAE